MNFLPDKVFGQKVTFCSLSGAERWWVITHPFVAKRALKVSRIALSESRKLEKDTVLDRDPAGGRVDAFRHAYWMALLVREMKAAKALALGRAHEKGNYKRWKKQKKEMEEGVVSDSVMSAMDLLNNQTGVELGLSNLHADSTELKRIIINAVLVGKMKIVLKDLSGNWLLCTGELPDKSLYLQQWNIPKCLVSSKR